MTKKKMVTLRLEPKQIEALHEQARQSHLSLNMLVAAKLGLVEYVCQTCGVTSDDPNLWANEERTLCNLCRDTFSHEDGRWHGLGDRLRKLRKQLRDGPVSTKKSYWLP